MNLEKWTKAELQSELRYQNVINKRDPKWEGTTAPCSECGA